MIPPTLDEVRAYRETLIKRYKDAEHLVLAQNAWEFNPGYFLWYFETRDPAWTDRNGEKVVSWRLKMVTWVQHGWGRHPSAAYLAEQESRHRPAQRHDDTPLLNVCPPSLRPKFQPLAQIGQLTEQQINERRRKMLDKLK